MNSAFIELKKHHNKINIVDIANADIIFDIVIFVVIIHI